MSEQYIGNDLVELVKHLGKRQVDAKLISCEGLISSVDQKAYVAKVRLMPWDIETGWLPIGTLAAGNGWGIFHLPPDDTEVTVDFINGDVNNGRIRCCYSNRLDPPPQDLEQGEFLVRHMDGSFLRFRNGGDVEMHVHGNLSATVEGDASITGQGDMSATIQGDLRLSGASITLEGPTTVEGPLTVSEDATIGGKSFGMHTHSAPGGMTGPPS